ncbi:MAG: lysophospholipid transporter LplT [Bacillota bacterium]
MFRNRPVRALLTAQFLSAFVDNMILFIVQAIILRDHFPGYYLPLVQGTFLFSYIVLSPWVGCFADQKPKATVLIIGNVVKACGVLSLMLQADPALSYAIVGVGAVIYSPAKYGILPFLTRGGDALLLRANSHLESFTILAILSGAVAGGYLADKSIALALAVCLALYALSILVNKFIPRDAGNRGISYRHAMRGFLADTLTLLRQPQANYSLLGTGSFWLVSAVLRLIIFAWVPLTLGISSGVQIGLIMAVTAVGISLGAVLTPYIITLRTYTRTLWFGFGVAACIFSFMMIHSLLPTVAILLLLGCLGGIFIVPLNTTLQHVGHGMIGAGKTIAVQNFVENTCMFFGVGCYTLATKAGLAVNYSLAGTGLLLMGFLLYLLLLVKKAPADGMARSEGAFMGQ